MESNLNIEVSQRPEALKAHLALKVKSVDQSIDFYRRFFGIEPSKVRSGYAKFDVHNPPLNFTLNQGVVASGGTLSHLGIQMRSTEDVLATRQRWQDAGLVTRDEMEISCCFAVQDKAWVRDPDGNEWEVFVVLEDHLPETEPCECGEKLSDLRQPAAAQNQSSACCQTAQVNTSN